jgi:hypothetical protein
MKYLLYILFSTIEYSSLFVLMLALFRFQIKEYIKEILLASVINAVIALLLNYIGLQPISMFVKILFVMLCLIFIFKEKLLKSLWILVYGYALFMLIQTSLVGILFYYNLLDMANIDQYSFNSRLLLMITVVIVYSISIFIRKSNEGFGFSFHKKLFNSSKKLFIASSLTVLLITSSIVFLFFENGNIINFTVNLLISTVFIFILFWMSYAQEKKQFNN